ncbi:MAG: hypothetical protein L3J11_07890, partial [Draconibacterium sp.]|nr:hypothetical protein [Draconibacterium sp.]
MKINTKYERSLCIYFCLLVLVGISFNQSLFSQTYGLKFNAQDVTLDKRTELNLSPNDFMKFKDEFEIAFDYKSSRINSNSDLFGYVFRIINKEDKNIDLLSTPTPNIGLNLVVGESNKIVPIRYPLYWLNNLIKLRIKFILSEDRLIFYTPDTFYVHENVGLKKQEEVKIIFGVNDYKQFNSSIQERMIQMFNDLIFVKLEINMLNDVKFGEYIQDKELSNYLHYLKDVRKNRKYDLKEEEEQMINLKNQYGKNGFSKLYNELTSSFEFELEVDGEIKKLSGPQLRALRMNPDHDVRQRAMKLFFDKYKENKLVIVSIFNNLFKDYMVENQKRGY